MNEEFSTHHRVDPIAKTSGQTPEPSQLRYFELNTNIHWGVIREQTYPEKQMKT